MMQIFNITSSGEMYQKKGISQNMFDIFAEFNPSSHLDPTLEIGNGNCPFTCLVANFSDSA